MSSFWIIFFSIAALFAIPIAVRTQSLWPYLLGTLAIAAGILFPLLVFIGSADFMPEWKGEAPRGWVDCFHEAKFYLWPLIVWACFAFYADLLLNYFARHEAKFPNSLKLKPEYLPSPTPLWVILGLFCGSITILICTIWGIVVLEYAGDLSWGISIPAYLTLWYGWRWFCTQKERSKALPSHLYTLAGMTPCWWIVFHESHRFYENLPDSPPDNCFIVTAASQGDPQTVGPFFEVTHRGQSRQANQQLLTFWALEDAWQGHFPRSHRLFRAIYNRLAPPIARKINSQKRAELTHACLKPLELLAARLILGRVN